MDRIFFDTRVKAPVVQKTVAAPVAVERKPKVDKRAERAEAARKKLAEKEQVRAQKIKAKATRLLEEARRDAEAAERAERARADRLEATRRGAESAETARADRRFERAAIDADRIDGRRAKLAEKEEAYRERCADAEVRLQGRMAQCRESAAQCSTLKKWRTTFKADYSYSRSVYVPPGFFDEITAHLVHRSRVVDESVAAE